MYSARMKQRFPLD